MYKPNYNKQKKTVQKEITSEKSSVTQFLKLFYLRLNKERQDGKAFFEMSSLQILSIPEKKY